MIPIITGDTTAADMVTITDALVVGSILKFEGYETAAARFQRFVTAKIIINNNYSITVEDIRPGVPLYALYGAEHVIVTAKTS